MPMPAVTEKETKTDNPQIHIPMNHKLTVYCQNLNEYVEISGGDTLTDIWLRIRHRLDFTPICGNVNNKSESMSFPIYAPKTIEFKPRTSASGSRTYIRSLCMMLYHAVHHTMPGARLRIEHSLSRGYYCRITGGDASMEADRLSEILLRHMRQLRDRDIPFERLEQRTPDVIEIFRQQGLADKVLLLDSLHELYTVYYRLDGLSDSYYGPLAPSTGLIDTFDLIPYKQGFLLLGFSDTDQSAAQTPVEQEKMYRAFTDHLAFNHTVGVSNVGELNRAVAAGESPMLINVAEALHNNRIASIADEITRRYRNGGARVVMVAGPSSSGKTTFTKRLAIQLMTNLLEPKMISLDDYFVNRENTPLDESGEYDYESLYALDLPTFNDHLNSLIAGKEVELPYYNFETGSRQYRGHRIHLGDNSILLIEGIHGLNPELTAHVPDHMKYRIYVSALTTIAIDDHNWIPTTDNRLLRRIIRDDKYRGVSPTDTIRRWPSVRRGEERWIFPYQENADAMFNSSLLFELGVMKQHADKLLERVPHDVEEYCEAARLRRFLSYFASISEEFIPSTSLLREFLGGSSFKY